MDDWFAETNNLVYKTYQLVDSETTEVQLFKTFREVFYEHFCFGMTSLKSHQACENEEYTESGKYTQEVDGQFAVLLAEVCKMKHQAISKILDQPVEKIRLLLTSRRKSMLAGFLNLALYCCMDIHYT